VLDGGSFSTSLLVDTCPTSCSTNRSPSKTEQKQSAQENSCEGFRRGHQPVRAMWNDITISNGTKGDCAEVQGADKRCVVDSS